MVKPSNENESKSIEIATTRKTKTVSGKSDLTYHLGKDNDANMHMRIWVNSSNGFFSNEWIQVSAIIELLEKQGGESFTSYVFESLFKGKSVNTPGFLVAALLNEGLLALEEGKKRKYVYVSAGNISIKSHEAKPRKAPKKSAAKPSKTTKK